MYIRLFKNEFARHKTIYLALCLFLTLSTMLLSSAIYLGITLKEGISDLTEHSQTPHYIQMHYGEIDEQSLIGFNESIPYIKNFQVQEMISIDPNKIYISKNGLSEVDGVMDISFVKQNSNFDFLLNENNELATIEQGSIGVPIYYKTKYNLDLMDEIELKVGSKSFTYYISSFIRDSQMNSALISSKRFLLNDQDIETLKSMINEREFLIAYQFENESQIRDFRRAYRQTDLPDSGPSVDIRLFRLMNGLTEGIVIMMLAFMSLAITGIALLSLKFTLLSSIEEDIREIGVLKAIGLSDGQIKKLYLSKFLLLSIVSAAVGFGCSFISNQFFINNITQYLGEVSLSFVESIYPFFGFMTIIFTVYIFTNKILKRLEDISVVDTFSLRNSQNSRFKKKKYKNLKSGKIPVPINMGVHKVKSEKKAYRLLYFIYFVATIMMVLPFSVAKTFESDDFIEYMGIENSDLRFDLRVNHQDFRVDELLFEIQEDDQIDDYNVYKTFLMKAYNLDDEIEDIFVEVSTKHDFKIKYIEGRGPENDDEIVLSTLAIQALDQTLGGTLEVKQNDQMTSFKVVGIYQDITNGGKTAKIIDQSFEGELLWYIISMNLKEPSRYQDVKTAYQTEYANIKVTSIDEYLSQTLGTTIHQLNRLSWFSIAIALMITVLVTTLLMNMMLQKEEGDIVLMQYLGFSWKNISAFYQTRIIYILLKSISVGLIAHLLIGSEVVSVITRIFGAPQIVLKNHLEFNFVLVPFVLLSVVVISLHILLGNYNSQRNKNKKEQKND